MINLTSKQKRWIINELDWEEEQSNEITLLMENEGVIVMPWEVEGTSCEESYPYSLGVKCNEEYYELDCITIGFLSKIMTEGNL